jgi:hypothetical protein
MMFEAKRLSPKALPWLNKNFELQFTIFEHHKIHIPGAFANNNTGSNSIFMG